MAAPNKGHSSEGSHIALKRLRTSKSASRLFLNLVDTVRPSDPSSAHPSPRNLHAHGVSKPLSRAARSHSELEDSKTMRVLMGAESEFDSLPPALRRKVRDMFSILVLYIPPPQVGSACQVCQSPPVSCPVDSQPPSREQLSNER